jgi:hypothetical protein
MRGWMIGASLFTAAFLIIAMLLFRYPSILVREETRIRGEFYGFRIGMNKQDAMSVIEGSFLPIEGVFLSGSPNASVPVVRLTEAQVLPLPIWQVAFGKRADSIDLRFCGDELVVITRYRNYWGDSS